MEDGRCKLGLAGRLELVRLVESGWSLRAAAAALNVAPATAHRWWHRWRAASEAERVSRACLRARPPVPRSCPWALSAQAEERILRARAQTNLGPARLAGLVGYRRSTIWKVLQRHGCSQRRRSEPRQTSRRFEWAEPGALLHIDTMQLPRFDAPGHWATGDRAGHRSRGAGTVHVVSVIDDHSRLAYCELHSAEDRWTTSATLRRAAAWMREQGCGPVQAVMSDNHKASPAITSRPCSPSSALATSPPRPTPRAGTARPSASTAPSTTNGPNPRSGPPAAPATAPWHRSCASTDESQVVSRLVFLSAMVAVGAGD